MYGEAACYCLGFFGFAAMFLFVVPVVYSEVPDQERGLAFLRDVVGLDVEKYEVSVQGSSSNISTLTRFVFSSEDSKVSSILDFNGV